MWTKPAAGNCASPLYVAAHKGHGEVVKALIKARCDVDKALNGRHTPLYAAAQ